MPYKFVKEENWHSAYLLRYMNYYQEKPAKKSFLDHMFRKARQMLYDELPHIMFQSYTLSHFKNGIWDKWMRVLLMEIMLAPVSQRKFGISASVY